MEHEVKLARIDRTKEPLVKAKPRKITISKVISDFAKGMGLNGLQYTRLYSDTGSAVGFPFPTAAKIKLTRTKFYDINTNKVNMSLVQNLTRILKSAHGFASSILIESEDGRTESLVIKFFSKTDPAELKSYLEQAASAQADEKLEAIAKKRPSLSVVLANKLRSLGLVCDRLIVNGKSLGYTQIKLYDLFTEPSNLKLVDAFNKSLQTAPGFLGSEMLRTSDKHPSGIKKHSLILKFALDTNSADLHNYLNTIKASTLKKMSKTSVAVCPHCGK